MAEYFPCPYLGARVELTAERRQYILASHPELLPEHLDWMEETILEPELVLVRPGSSRARMLVRWYARGWTGKFAVVVVVTDPGHPPRHWIVTACIARDLPNGDVE